jgi:hypothetical protein
MRGFVSLDPSLAVFVHVCPKFFTNFPPFEDFDITRHFILALL